MITPPDAHSVDRAAAIEGAASLSRRSAIAAIAPTAMVFVRGQYDGISRNPREYSTPEDCAAGAAVLGTTVLRLAEEVGA